LFLQSERTPIYLINNLSLDGYQVSFDRISLQLFTFHVSSGAAYKQKQKAKK